MESQSNFRLEMYPAAQCLPPELLVAAQRRAPFFAGLYGKQQLSVDDFIADLYIAWSENPDLPPELIVSKLNSRIRRDCVEDKIAKSSLAADVFFRQQRRNDDDEDDGADIAVETGETETETEEAQREIIDHVLAFTRSPYGMGLSKKTVHDYVTTNPHRFFEAAKSRLAAFNSVPKSRRRCAPTHSMDHRGRPRNFRLVPPPCGDDPFKPHSGNYYRDPARYNALRAARRAQKRWLAEQQLSLF